MKQIALLGNTDSLDKTFVTASLTHLASQEGPIALVDGDLDGTRLSMFLTTRPDESHAWRDNGVARIDSARCKSCGTCFDVCQFNAVSAGPPYTVISLACIGCGTCLTQCPVNAITMIEINTGKWHRSDTRFGPLFHGEIEPGRRNSGSMVTLLRQQASIWAQQNQAHTVIIDGPSGISSPALVACAGVDLAILVIMPTVDTVRDLDRLYTMTGQIRTPVALITSAQSSQVESLNHYCDQAGITMLGQIEEGAVASQAMNTGRLMTEMESPIGDQLSDIWHQVTQAASSLQS